MARERKAERRAKLQEMEFNAGLHGSEWKAPHDPDGGDGVSKREYDDMVKNIEKANAANDHMAALESFRKRRGMKTDG